MKTAGDADVVHNDLSSPPQPQLNHPHTKPQTPQPPNSLATFRVSSSHTPRLSEPSRPLSTPHHHSSLHQNHHRRSSHRLPPTLGSRRSDRRDYPDAWTGPLSSEAQSFALVRSTPLPRALLAEPSLRRKGKSCTQAVVASFVNERVTWALAARAGDEDGATSCMTEGRWGDGLVGQVWRLCCVRRGWCGG